MSINISKGNMYKFVTHTWNTIKGTCPLNCKYCYMKKYWRVNNPYFSEYELKTNLGRGNFIFVGSSCDMFADNIPAVWIQRTIDHCNKFNNRYFLQTKNPKRLHDFNFMKGRYQVSTTTETNRIYKKYMGIAPAPEERAKHMPKGHSITIEPIMKFDLNEFVTLIKNCEPQYVNIGADSGNNGLPEPSKKKVLKLIDELKTFTKVYQKDNLKRIIG